MNSLTRFKNFSLGTEIDIAGSLAYSALSALNATTDLFQNDQLFLFLYNAAVSVERMQKCVLFMYGDYDESTIDLFTKQFCSHDHQMLQCKVNECTKTKLTEEQNAFLVLLKNFYSDGRYANFSFGSNYCCLDQLILFVQKQYGNQYVSVNPISNRAFVTEAAKERIGRTLGKILCNYYKLIKERACVLGVYTYELRSGSPAEKVFTNTFPKKSLQAQNNSERNSLKELLIYLINTKETTGFLKYIRHIEPLQIDPYLAQEYLYEILHKQVPQSLIDEVDSVYEEFDPAVINDRKDVLSIFDVRNTFFPEDDEDFEDSIVSDNQ